MELVAQLPESQLESALLYFRALVAAGSWPSLVGAQLDDEPYTDQELHDDVEILNRLPRATLLTTQELSRELDL